MAFYRRNLPHWHPEGASLFLTWRLFGSLPADARSRARLEGKGKSTARIGCATKPPNSRGRVFKLGDSLLAKADKGPLWLKDPRVAGFGMAAVHFGEKKRGLYSPHLFVIIRTPEH